ncbi:hypothetical protein Q7P37_008035 [Cladosporium fusiforme]
MEQTGRQYEAVVFGATGYTGRLTAEYITTNLPTDFKWAIAGRSAGKLKALADDLQTLNPDRTQPSIEVAQLEKADLLRLASTTKVLITTVGPYHKYGTAVVEACVETGTHYLDVTGEVPWVHDIIKKYHEQAKQSGAIVIPQNGIESAPTDLMCWALVSYIRKTLGVGTGEVVYSIHDLKATASGGTLSTILTLLDSYSLMGLSKSFSRWALSTVKPPKQSYSKPIYERLTGLRTENDLGGLLADSIQGPTDIPLVHRSWSLYEGGSLYGPNFYLSPYMRAKNLVHGLALRIGLTFGFLMLAIPFVRWILQRLVTQPGDGPNKEQASKEYVEWRAIAHADVTDPNDPKRVMGSMRYDGGMYALTGMLLAEAAITIARDQSPAHQLGGGVLTPATLGEAYLERVRKGGLKTEIRMMP